ncbi:hypothetical protein Bca101_072879 [Brassica carinata]
MTDARTAYTRRDGYSDRYAWKEGGKDRKLTSAYTRQNSQPHDAYNVERIESFAHRTQLRNIGESFVHQPADETFHDSHKSSGKRIASQIVTPARHDNDDNFLPTEKVLPADAHIIGALNDMEIIDTTNTDVELHDTMMVAETQDDDLLWEDLMDMEDGTNTETEGNGRKVVWKGDTTALVKLRSSSSYKSGGRSLGLQSNKAGFLRRGSPQARRSSSRDKAHLEKQHPGPIKSSRDSTRKGNGLEGSKSSSEKYP